MKGKAKLKSSPILPVSRTKEEARQLYDRISKIYDFLTWAFERPHAEAALKYLGIAEGETVLEIGFGTGHCFKQIAESVGSFGKAHGIDISPDMLKVTKNKLGKAGLADRVELYCGDAASLPYDDNTFDAVFTSFTLELFDTPEIPEVLKEIKRVLKPNGRLGIVSLSRENGRQVMLKLYEWVHKKWPKYADCRPIYLEHSLIDAGYAIKHKEKVSLFGLPCEIVIALDMP